jgi:hypothetical protein
VLFLAQKNNKKTIKMILRLINRIVKNRVKYLTFPILNKKEYNKLWRMSQIKFISLPLGDCIPIIKNLVFYFGTASLLAVPAIF